MELSDALKIFGGTIAGFLLTRVGRSSDKQQDHEVRIALLEAGNIRQDKDIERVENKADAANSRIDKLKAKVKRVDGGKDDHDFTEED